MSDDTEALRRQMVPKMPAALMAARARGDRTWTTEELRQEFEVLSFLAPFVTVRRRRDGTVGTLMFTHNPRTYFGWQEDE